MAEIVQEMSKNFKIVPKQLYFVFVSFWVCVFFLAPKKLCQKDFSDHVTWRVFQVIPERFFRSCHFKGFSNDPRKISQIMSRWVFQIMPETFFQIESRKVFQIMPERFFQIMSRRVFFKLCQRDFSDQVKEGGFSNHARKIFQIKWRIIKQACQISWHHVHDGADPWVLSCVRSCLFCNLWVFSNVEKVCFWFVYFQRTSSDQAFRDCVADLSHLSSAVTIYYLETDQQQQQQQLSFFFFFFFKADHLPKMFSSSSRK